MEKLAAVKRSRSRMCGSKTLPWLHENGWFRMSYFAEKSVTEVNTGVRSPRCKSCGLVASQCVLGKFLEPQFLLSYTGGMNPPVLGASGVQEHETWGPPGQVPARVLSFFPALDESCWFWHHPLPTYPQPHTHKYVAVIDFEFARLNAWWFTFW